MNMIASTSEAPSCIKDAMKETQNNRALIAMALSAWIGLEGWQSISIVGSQKSQIDAESKWFVLGEVRNDVRDLGRDISDLGLKQAQIEVLLRQHMKLPIASNKNDDDSGD